MDGPVSEVADAYQRDVKPSSVAGSALSARRGPVPVYRFRSEHYGADFLTVDESEKREVLDNPWWRPAGVAYRAFSRPEPGTKPLHRFYAKELRCHFFTINPRELETLRGSGVPWIYEGVSHHVYPAERTGTVPVFRFRGEKEGKPKFLFTADAAEAKLLRTPDSGWIFEKTAYWGLPT